MNNQKIIYELKPRMLDTESELILYIKKSTVFLSDLFVFVISALLSIFFFYSWFLGAGKGFFAIGIISVFVALYSLTYALREQKKLKGRIGAEIFRADKRGIYFESRDSAHPSGKCREWKDISKIVLAKRFVDETFFDMTCYSNKILIFQLSTTSELLEATRSSRTPEGDLFLSSNFPKGEIVKVREVLQHFAENKITIVAAKDVIFDYERKSIYIEPISHL
ncbi:MAG: hypothetical protein D3925_12090 [Candidatus Electrothrix sp. AR5]|nr:hypothetical protein [Candidatus Electrothrix sp. AR5]